MTAAAVQGSAVPARHPVTGAPNGVLVELHITGVGEPLIELVPLDEHGRGHGDGLVLDVAAAADLAARVRALVVEAGGPW